MKKSLKLLSGHLQSRQQGEIYALDYLERLNLAGLDYKGQCSTAYGQSGIGLSLGVAFDFGGMFCPGAHLTAELDTSVKRTAHTLIVLDRGPTKAWINSTITPPQPAPEAVHQIGYEAELATFPKPDWETDRPISLGNLRGYTWDFEADLTGSAWVGFGNAFDVDETGVAVGVKLGFGGIGSRTRLVDPAPRQYTGTFAAELKNDIHAIFRDSVKRKAAAWLMASGLGIQAAKEAGVPLSDVAQRARKLKIVGAIGLTAERLVIDAANVWDTHDTSIANRGIGKSFSSLISGVRALGLAAKKKATSAVLKTDDLIDALEQAIKLFEKFIKERENEYREPIEKAGLTVDEAELKKQLALELPPARLRIEEARELIQALKTARALKAGILDSRAAETGVPRFHLDVNVIEGHTSGQLGGKFVLPFPVSDGKIAPSASASLSASVGGEAYSRRIGSRYQCYTNASFANPKPGSSLVTQGRVLISTQDAVVQYNSRLIKGHAKAGSSDIDAEKELKLITMSYRAVLANWFDDIGIQGHQALPNGSGISFGMSILKSRITAYVDACKTIQDKDLESGSMPDNIAPFEKVMVDQLRVRLVDLRRCFRTLPEWLTEKPRAKDKATDFVEAEELDCYVIESSFAITRAQKMTIDNRRPENLFDLPALKRFDTPGEKPDDENTRQQVIRVRFRIRSDEDRTRNYFNLGWNPMTYLAKDQPNRESTVPFMSENNYEENLNEFEQFKNFGDWKSGNLVTPSMPAMISLGVERVERVGMEGLITVHEHHTPARYSTDRYLAMRAGELERLNARQNAELLVPPVKLFSQ